MQKPLFDYYLYGIMGLGAVLLLPFNGGIPTRIRHPLARNLILVILQLLIADHSRWSTLMWTWTFIVLGTLAALSIRPLIELAQFLRKQYGGR